MSLFRAQELKTICSILFISSSQSDAEKLFRQRDVPLVVSVATAQRGQWKKNVFQLSAGRLPLLLINRERFLHNEQNTASYANA